VSPPPVPIIQLAPAASAKHTRALKYQLLPDQLDLTPGNAAPLWIRAGQTARGVRHKLTEPEANWESAERTPLKDLPKPEVREFLAQYASALRLADQAARRERCDWEMTPFTMQQQDLPLDELQTFRQLANLLNVRCRLEVSEGKIDQAIATLQTGFALARHVGEADMLIQYLVGIAIANVMLARVEEIMQQPNAPNLYWALTTLPSPFLDLRRPVKSELNILSRSFPQLRELEKGTLTADQVEKVVEELSNCCGTLGPSASPWMGKLAVMGATIKYYPDARQYFLDRGRTAAQLDAMPGLQVVMLSYLDQYNVLKDDVEAWMSVPPWQARAGLEKIEKRVRGGPRALNGNFIVVLLFPAILKVHDAHTRTERLIATLRCAEALRRYAAEHQGQPPEKLADVTEVPLPLDPATGQTFNGFYQRNDGKGIFEVPSLHRSLPQQGRRFELSAPGKQ
jgi:hypothetical protein